MSRARTRSERRAILVLESPWALDDSDSNRSSVRPFVEGMAKMEPDVDVFSANFYDKNSFRLALECLCKVRFDNAIIYVAAHGYPGTIGGVKITDAMVMIGEAAKKHGITGLMLGSCFVGGDTVKLEVFIEGTGLRWAAGYSSSCNWLEGTLVDCNIMAKMLHLHSELLSEKDEMIEQLATATALFVEDYEIGEDLNDETVLLRDSLEFVIQPSGSGKRAKRVTDEVFALNTLEEEEQE
ncbi:hypothetical protein [Halopseudomonas sp.]|uniref:hypothetical protein n=1 Tax=Halopseudomonas sp. TaxID=2901191 RepID=UPI003002A2DC